MRRVLMPGDQLPSSRNLGQQLGVHWLTVIKAYRELAAMDYVELDVGRGSFVSNQIPEMSMKPARPGGEGAKWKAPRMQTLLAARVKRLATRMPPLPIQPSSDGDGTARIWLAPKGMDVRLFPKTAFLRYYRRHLSRLDHETLEPENPLGSLALRHALREKLLPTRGIRAELDQIAIVSSAIHGLSVSLDLLVQGGDTVLMEEPGWPGMREITRLKGARPLPVAVSEKGIHLKGIQRLLGRHRPRAVFLTPSHQAPTGVTLDYNRRLAFLNLLQGHPTWILEADFDHEFHYDSPPLPSLHAMDRTGRVLYFGSFSKVMLPELRMGFIVGPAAFIRMLRTLVLAGSGHTPGLPQRAMTDFLMGGHYDHHIRRLRRIYLRRRNLMVSELRRELPDFTFASPKGGLNLWVRLPEGMDADILQARLLARGIHVLTGRGWYLGRPQGSFLHLSFSSADENEIRQGVRTMADVAKRLKATSVRADASRRGWRRRV